MTKEAGTAVEYAARLSAEGQTANTTVRDKLLRKEAGFVSTTDLLTYVTGGQPKTVRRLLSRHGLAGIPELHPRGLRGEGLAQGAASRLAAVCELAKRLYGAEATSDRPKVSRPTDAFRLVRHLGRLKKEHLVGLYLDAQNGLIQQETISIGSLNTTRTHPREILQPAVIHLALGFILAHNHPSGCLDPSPEDVEFTQAVRRAGELLGIELYDHLIVADSGYCSLRERGFV